MLAVRAATTLDPPIVTAAGLTIRDTVPTTIIPNVVLSLAVTGLDTGVNAGTFDKNGNKTNTTYVVYARPNSTSPWVQVGTTTTQKFFHKGQTPGVHMEYSIIATRGVRESDRSNVASVY